MLVVDFRQKLDAGGEQSCRHRPATPSHGEMKDFFAGRNDEIYAFRPNQRLDRLGVGPRLEARRRQAMVARAGLARGGDWARRRVGQDHPAAGAMEKARQMQRHRRARPGDEHGFVSPRHQVSRSFPS
ncbi:MAG: hypothetical protein E5V89_21345 [Mesorhizobium sp.]|nr:MAG: hypothetical protein E5V89_21345 [Mesorhizobium sp.]